MAKERRHFSREFKLMALARLETAGNVKALALELGIRRELLYKWSRQYAEGGEAALKPVGRPRPTGAVSPEAMAAGEKMAELERKVGRQQLELDFFREALQRLKALGLTRGGPGGRGSTR